MKPLLTVACLLASSAYAQRVVRLGEALGLAAENQPTLKQSIAVTDAAEGRRMQVRSVLLPQVAATALYQRVHGSARLVGNAGGGVSAAGGTTSSASTYNVFSIGLTASQVLWDFAAIERFRAAGLTVDAQRATERATKLQIELQVRTAFFQARAQRSLMDVGQQTLDNELKHQQQIQGFVKAGIRPEIDMAQSQVAVANAQVSLVNARNGYLIAKAQLRQAVGGLAGDFEVGTEEMPALDNEGASLDDLTLLAVKNRPELASLLAQQDATTFSIRAAQGGYIPTLGASGGVSETGTSIDALQPNWQFGLTLTWNIFQGGLTAGQVHEQRANGDLIDAQLQTQRLEIQLQVEQAQALLKGGLSSLEAATAAETAARTQLQLAEARYTQGVGNIIEQGDAQIAFTTAAAQRVQAQLNIFAARAQLLAALGQST